MALKRIKTALREWNRRRLGKRSAAKVKQQSLGAVNAFKLVGFSANASLELMPCVDAIRQHGLQVQADAVQPLASPKTLMTVYGASIWASPHEALAQNLFGLCVVDADLALIDTAQSCRTWFGSARFVWASSMAVVRQLVKVGVPSSKVYLLPTEKNTPDIAGAELFHSSGDIQQFFSSRFLLAYQIISFDDFYQKCASGMHPLPDTLCLGVVEYVARLDDFMSEGTGIAYFPGVRHTTGWVGCGLSYKFLFCLAKRDQLNTLTICEDDVLLPANWQAELQGIRSKIQPAFDKGQAHVFAGIVTTLPDDAVLLSHEDFGERKLVTLNKTTGTVFNVYSQQTIHYMSEWNHARHDLVSNTIDKYLMNKADLRALALVPFFVQHKEDIVSTLWNTNNGDTYNAVFDQTQQRILQMMSDAKQLGLDT